MRNRSTLLLVSVLGVYLSFAGAQATACRQAAYTPGLSVSPTSKVSTKSGLPLSSKVVYLKGTALVTANADGSKVQVLLNDGVSKSDPHWSPGGDKIVYQTACPKTEGPKCLVNLVVITSSGQLVSTIPVRGAEWVLFRGVEIGWSGNDTVFAKGFLNTVVCEYRLIEARSGRLLRSYRGDQFGTCEAQAKVAAERMAGRSGERFVEVNGSAVYTLPEGSSVSFGMHWFADCSRLTFLESTFEGTNVSATLVVVAGTSVEAKIPIPASTALFVPVGASFMIGGSTFMVDGDSGVALLYDTTTHTLHPAPDILEQLQQRQAADKQVMETLGGESPDWYRQEL